MHTNIIFTHILLVKVKEYIRRAKAWRNKMWPIEQGGAGKPSSYLMSLLVLRAYEIGGSDDERYICRLVINHKSRVIKINRDAVQVQI